MSNAEHSDKAIVQAAELAGEPSRRLAVYMLACVAGSLLLDLSSTIPLLSYAGMILLAYGATVLATRERVRYAYLSVVLASVVGFWMQVPTGVCCFAVGLTIASLAWKAPNGLGSGRMVACAVICGLAMLASDLLAARLAGTTLTGQLSAATAAAVQAVNAVGSVPAETLTVIKSGLSTIASLWPSVYMVEGLLCVVLAKLSCNVALRRHGIFREADGFTRIKLSIHTALVLVSALACLVVSHTGIEQAAVAKAVAYNLLVCSAALYAVQGLSVCGFFMLRHNLHGVLRVVLYLLLVQMELMFLVPTLIGIVDLWANFRKLEPSGEIIQEEDKAQDNG